MHPVLLLSMLATTVDTPPGAPLTGLQRCAGIVDPTMRLACYDHEGPMLIAAWDKKQVVVVTREEVKRTRRTLFGLPLPDLGLFGNSGDDEAAKDGITEISSRIASARQTGLGRWAFTLAEGGVWETTDADTNMFIKSGRSVTIRATAFAFRARIGNESWVRVKRLR